MKRYLYFMIMLMFLSFFSCNEDDIKVFDGQAQLYFDKFYMNALQPGTEGADSTVMLFFFYPDDTKTIEAEVVVNYSGLPLTADIPFTLKVMEREQRLMKMSMIWMTSMCFMQDLCWKGNWIFKIR